MRGWRPAPKVGLANRAEHGCARVMQLSTTRF
jgi:hypothetical protein